VKLSRVRLTVRRLMILVAACALASAVPGWMDRRRAEFLQIAARHESELWIAYAYGGGRPGPTKTTAAIQSTT
jgi:hypothetical protein